MSLSIFALLAFFAIANAQWISDCGRSKYPNPAPEQRKDNSRNGRIVGGWESRQNEFPYQISLQRFGSHTCGGVILNQNWVLTAAHCVSSGSASGLSVVAGAHRRNSPSGTEQTSTVLQVKNHESYNSPNRYDNDISLLRLSSPLSFNSNVRPACQPNTGNYQGSTVTISGWGTTFSGGFVTNELRYTNVDVWSTSDCLRQYPGQIGSSMICAASPGRDTCQGDSGGPMTFNNNGRFEVVGLTSWGRGCAGAAPGVYAKVGAQLTWIRNNAQ